MVRRPSLHSVEERPLSRSNDRGPEEFRPIRFTRAFTGALGSVLVEAGNTRVLCTVTITEQTPPWMQHNSGGWLTAEYSMLPASTHTRKPRERGHRVDGRSQEIQRLLGRALRSVIDLKSLPDITLWVDCDVIAADGGTRTTAINGACVALHDALLALEEQKKIRNWPMRGLVSATAVGMFNGQPLVDMDYSEDSKADVDMNIVCGAEGRLIEVQGSAEGAPFERSLFDTMLTMAQDSCAWIQDQQKQLLGL